MTQIQYLWQQATAVLGSLVSSMNGRNILDICIVATLVYYATKLIRQTRANSVIKGFAAMLALMWLSEVLSLNTINWILRQVVGAGTIMLVVLFQPEIRRALEQVGRSSLYSGLLNTSSAKTDARSAERSTEEIVHALTNLSRRKVGALIVMERKTGLKDIVASGTTLDAEISSALIENVFEPNTPLHDGAMVVKEGRITAAACFLPLSENSSISRELGTRHRAALGISETTDALVLIVSEETGVISMAREGRLTRYLDGKALTNLLMSTFSPEAPTVKRVMVDGVKTILKRKEKQHEGEN